MICSAQVKKLTETKGNIHEYLGFTIDFSGRYYPKDPDKKEQVIFTMYSYIEDIIGSTTPDMNRVALDLAKSKLFTVHKPSPPFDFFRKRNLPWEGQSSLGLLSLSSVS